MTIENLEERGKMSETSYKEVVHYTVEAKKVLKAVLTMLNECTFSKKNCQK